MYHKLRFDSSQLTYSPSSLSGQCSTHRDHVQIRHFRHIPWSECSSIDWLWR